MITHVFGKWTSTRKQGEVIIMNSDKPIKKEKEIKREDKKKTGSDLCCCYTVDPCGCYVDPCGCQVSTCCC